MRNLLPLLLVCLVGAPVMAVALTDPTRPQDLSPEKLQSMGVIVEPAEPIYTLQYVLHSEQRKFAVINGKRVREGDRVNEARVLRIQPGIVYIRTPAEVRELKLGYTDIKREQGRVSK